MSWTLNGYPVLFDHEGTLQKCWDVFMPKNYWATSMPWWVNDDRRSSRSEHRDGRDLPHPNWTPQPDPELNVLFAPNGASRWTQVCVLIDTYDWTTTELNSLYNGESLRLKLREPGGQSNGISFGGLYCQRAMTVSGHSEGQNVQLLTLVDSRYFWQWQNYQLEVTSSTTWKDLIEELLAYLYASAVTIDSGYVDSRYGKPDATEFTRYGNAALMLDAALWSVGKMYSIANDFDSFLTLKEARNHENLVMGRRFPIASMFDSVDLVCRRKIEGVIRPDLEPYIHNETITTDTGTRPYYKTDHKAVIFTTMTADDTQAAYDGDADSPSNQSTISDLCTALTEVYEAMGDAGCIDLILADYWGLEANDVSGGEQALIDTNWVDFTEYGMKLNVDLPMFSGLKMGSTLEHQHVGYTRIKTLPPHFGSSFNLCQDGYFVDDHPAEVILFQLAEELTVSDEHVSATVIKYFNGKDPGSTVDVYNTETATTSVYGMATASGKFGYAYLDTKENKYYIIHLLC